MIFEEKQKEVFFVKYQYKDLLIQVNPI